MVIFRVYLQMGRPERALEAFVKGHAFRNAVELARRHFPSQVVGLEQAWGDHLVSIKQVGVSLRCGVVYGMCGSARAKGCGWRAVGLWFLVRLGMESPWHVLHAIRH